MSILQGRELFVSSRVHEFVGGNRLPAFLHMNSRAANESTRRVTEKNCGLSLRALPGMPGWTRSLPLPSLPFLPLICGSEFQAAKAKLLSS